MSGGVGSRFGAVIPKQYNLIAGRPVIDYVLDAVEASKKTERTVIVMDQHWIQYSGKIRNGAYDIAPNGMTRIESLYNGLKLIKEKYACNKVVVVDAVGPFLYGDLIDEYFDKLDTYEAVITSQKITGGFTDIYDHNLDREQYIITQSPEGFQFELLWNNYKIDFPYQETAGMLPKWAKRYYNFEFKNNLKLTYDFELSYAEFMLSSLGKANRESNIAFFDKSILITEGLKGYLLRTEPKKTLQWIDGVYSYIPKLISKWELTSFLPNQLSRYGIVLQANSRKYGDVILKFIPEFVNRFARELEAIRILPASYMCRLIDVEVDCNCMLLEKITPARFGCFEENIKLTEFFSHVVEDAVLFTEETHLENIPFYLDELRDKLFHIDTLPNSKDLVEPELVYAIELFQKTFSDSKLYILHGDLHEQNILDNGKRFYGIDPNGFLAPIEFECVRFIRNDVRNHPSFGFKERFDILIRNFGRFVDIFRLADAFIIDMAFCTFNSVFENEETKETVDDLDLIKTAKEWKRENTIGSIH